MEIAERRRCSLPPVTRMARIVVRDEDHLRSQMMAKDLFARLEMMNQSQPVGTCSPSSIGVANGVGSDVLSGTSDGAEDGPAHATASIRLRGPAPCPISRI